MTLDEAKDAIGRLAVYQPHPGARLEEGVITGVGEAFVFVRYGSDQFSTSTPADRLTLIKFNGL